MATTLITGASSGIGKVLAGRFAERGDDLVLVARRASRLDELAAELTAQHDSKVTCLPLDLSTPDAAAVLEAQLAERGLTVDRLVNNAGFANHGNVASADPDRLSAEIAVNCQAVVGLTSRLLPAMLAQGSGTVINIASTAAFQPVPQMAVYAATKAFVLSFTEALWSETQNTGVRVFAVCPGSTDTEFFEHAGEAAIVGKKRSTDELVEQIMRAEGARKPSIVDGFTNAVTARLLTRLLPKRAVLRVAALSVE